MSKREKVEFMTDELLVYLAEEMQEHMSNFMDSAIDGSDADMTYTAVALWQLSKSMCNFFKSVTTEGIKIGGDAAKAQAIANEVSKKFKGKMQSISSRANKLYGEDARATSKFAVRSLDSSKN